MNPFQILLAFLNLCAAGWYLKNGSPMLAGLAGCYAISSLIMGFMRGL